MTHGAHIGPIHPVVLALKAERIRQDMSMKTLGELAFCGHSQVSRIENGHVSPTLSTLSSIARALGVELMLLSSTEAYRVRTERAENAQTEP